MNEKATILLVEDDQSMLGGMRDLLMAADIGYDVRVMMASDGRSGLEQMEQETPDLIVSDIMMPHMDGFEFLGRVRSTPAWIQIPFIFLTAKGEKQDIHYGRRSGADLYIVKPFDSNELLELIQGQLDRSFSLREARQQNVEHLKKNILQILNHEFRTPLTYVTAYYEMLADSVSRFSNEQNFHEYLRGIQKGCIRLSTLVDDLVQVLELRTGEIEETYRARAQEINDLPALVGQVVNSFAPWASNKGVTLHYVPAQNVPSIHGDPDSLRNILQRLIDNAIKFSQSKAEQGSDVYVSTEMRDSTVRISLEDHGVGIPERMKARIFELFFQHNRETWEQQGAGVGLTIAKELVELHNGRIEVESEEGVGSKFTVVLPVRPRHQQTVEESEHLKRVATVLIVEDDLHLLQGLEELLDISVEHYLYHTLTASNGKMALEVLASHQPDLIISDIMMPKMGGFEFLEQVRRNPDWVEIPFIFLTAKGEQHEIHSGLRSGVEEYITKPYDSDELLELVATQLDRHFQVQGVVAKDFETLKRDILSLITPDFRLPLSSVTKYSERLAMSFEQALDEEDLKGSLRGIRQGSIRLARLVEDFISLAELKTGEASTAHELNSRLITEVGALLAQMGQPRKDSDELHDLKIHFTVEPELPAIYGDAMALLDVLQRLIETGINEFGAHSDGDVFLSAAQTNGHIRLAVRFPIRPGNRAFARVARILNSDDSVQQETRHTLPGLSIAKGIVQLHGGSVEASADESHGCEFVINLPTYSPPIKFE